MMILLAGACMLAACSGNLSQTFVSTIQPPATAQTERAAAQTSDAVPYEIVAEGDPMTGTGQNSAAVAWRPGTAEPAGLTAFPDEAQAAWAQLQTQAGSDLYLAIYGGVQPSSGYEVKILAVLKQDNRLQVTYQVAGPPPGQGAATVMTHPYVIARIADTTTAPADVVFVEQKVVR
jgi:hypothetical protein